MSVYKLCVCVYSTVNNNFSSQLLTLVLFNLQADILKFALSALIVCVLVCLNACLPTVSLVTDSKCLFGWPLRCMLRG